MKFKNAQISDLTPLEQKFYTEFINNISTDKVEPTTLADGSYISLTEISYQDGVFGMSPSQIGAVITTLKEKGIVKEVDTKNKVILIEVLCKSNNHIDNIAYHVSTEKFRKEEDNTKLAKFVLRLMKDFNDCSQGTITNPFDLASSTMEDGRTLIQTIKEDGYVRYNDGWNIVEVDDTTCYLDFTGHALVQMGNPDYLLKTDLED